MKFKTIALGLGLAAASAFGAAAETWKLAVTDVQGMERLQLEWGPFKEALDAATGDTFEFVPVNSRTAAAEALRGETVDFVISGPAEYVVINKLTEARPLIGLGRPDYFCGIITRADSGITSVDQLVGEKVAMSDIGSTSGHLCPLQLLNDLGVAPDSLGEIVHTSSNIMHEALKNGDVAAAAYNYTSWLRIRDEDTSVPAGYFRVLARSGDLPNDMIMVGAHVPDDVADKVRDNILENKDAIIAGIVATEDNAKYNGMDLVAIEDKAYNHVRSMYSTAGFPQFDDFIGE
jgi:phosphonate transport system substrate-binding protein